MLGSGQGSGGCGQTDHESRGDWRECVLHSGRLEERDRGVKGYPVFASAYAPVGSTVVTPCFLWLSVSRPGIARELRFSGGRAEYIPARVKPQVKALCSGGCCFQGALVLLSL